MQLNQPIHRQLILASTSAARQSLLAKLDIDFTCVSPTDVDETPVINETAPALVKRLSIAKAMTKKVLTEDAVVIGSDQVAVIDNQIIGKPLTVEKACQQLKIASGKKVTFYTGVAVFDAKANSLQYEMDTFNVYFRQLTATEITDYVTREQPLYCAGSFKSEGLGIALFEKLEGKDPNALVGLPLIVLIKLLANAGIKTLG